MNSRFVSSFFVRRSNSHVFSERRSGPRNHERARLPVIIAASLFMALLSLLLAACSSPFSGGATPTSTPANLPLTQLHWCGKPSMVFRDEGAHPSPTPTATPSATPATTATATVTTTGTLTPTASPTGTGPGTPTTVTDWSVVKASLGFTVYLPTTLPRRTCLVSAQATFHDPTIGGNFLIGYLLPDHTSIAISEAPMISQSQAFQCLGTNGTSPTSGTATPTPKAGTPQPTGTPTQTPLLVCSGVKSSTNIVLSARSSQAFLQQLFNNLQPNVAWIPAS